MAKKRKRCLGVIPAREYGPIIGQAMRNCRAYGKDEALCRNVVRSVEEYFQSAEYEAEYPRKTYRRMRQPKSGRED